MRRTLTSWLAVSFFVVSSAWAADKPVAPAKPAAAAPAAPAKAMGPVPEYALVKDKSSLKFYAIQNSAPVQGEFKDFSAVIHFDPEQLDKSSIVVEVATGSVAVANEEVEQNLKAADWLSVEAFPKAVFKTSKLTRMPMSDNYYASGDLTIRGKKVPAELNFQMERFDDARAIVKGFVTVHRRDFGIGQGEWAKDDVIKDEVRVEFRVVADKK